MKKLLLAGFVAMLMTAAGLFAGCEKGDLSGNYPQIYTVNPLISGSWKVSAWINEDGNIEEDNDEYVYNIQLESSIAELEEDDYDNWRGGNLTIYRNGNYDYGSRFYFEPIHKGDLDGSDSEMNVAVELYDNNFHYMISQISKSSMKWQEISFNNGKVIVSKKGMVFTKIEQ